MKRQDFNSLIDSSSFQELFITEMGWNNPSNRAALPISIDEAHLDFVPVAEKSGFHVYSCTVDALPSSSECKKIDNKLRNYGYDYICIFIQSGTSHHLWLTPIKANEKRELVKTEYLNGSQADFLYSKIDDLSFELTEQVLISDVKSRVQGSFRLNSEKITKDFYAQFRKEHSAFKKYIEGIDDEKNRDWYTSVMLNRLMFCYFIQKKGFLDQNTNYLQDKLRWVKEQKGNDQFFGTFYKEFLCAMFHEGLNHPRHDSDEFISVFGRIPYLNGGMFDDHQLEREYTGIDIPDDAFEKLFNFFDKWNWHLDTRLTSSGKDINPDVLGYIFEQYINDRAAMGAYYTKEDITEYIGKNCILPFLMDKTKEKSVDAFKPDGEVWQMLRSSGDRYIFDAVKKGYSSDWQDRIPDYIAVGLDTTDGTGLLERRARWNEKTHADFALPTEIWRETIERLQRCDTLLQKIAGGEIVEINDFITYNLDIRGFAEDVLRQTNDHLLVAHFYHALQNVTILDPTCGSGAFLFAALNILEPLYEVCIDRLEEFHAKNPNLFKQQLEEIEAKYSSNRQYFIYKSIILRNLYGVDIMVEATEIAKLRLFLKMVAVVEVDKRKDNLGLDPLPDIDFNIKCGNTLVGYATEAELENAMLYSDDLFASDELKQRIFAEMKIVATAYGCFRSEQLKTYDDNESIKKTKLLLKEKLANLNDLLNHKMFEAMVGSTGDYEAWLSSHQPFHWLAEFYQIIKGNGGFDVIIGNPPYVEYKKGKFAYTLSDSIYKTLKCSNLHAFVAERTFLISKTSANIGLIVPLPSMTTTRMESLQNIIKADSNHSTWISSYDERPSGLFEGVDQRLIIEIISKGNNYGLYTTKINRWLSENRNLLFSLLKFTKNSQFICKLSTSIMKLSSDVESSIYEKFYKNTPISQYKVKSSINNNTFHYRSAGGRYWKVFLDKPFGTGNSSEKCASILGVDKYTIISSLSSNVFWWYYSSHYDMFNLGDYQIFGFRLSGIDSSIEDKLIDLGKEYQDSLIENAIERDVKTGHGIVKQREYYVRKSKPIIDEIDKVLAKHYGFTDEELDFIINYDIKYRMGDELGADE